MCIRHPRVGLAVGLIFAASTALAANGIDVTRGQDAMVFGNCVPSLVVENKSAETIDYLQVDVVVALENGQERTVELKSAYREGVLYPIGPGGKATLKQHLDTSKALGVGCGDLKMRRVVRTICEAEGGRSCASSINTASKIGCDVEEVAARASPHTPEKASSRPYIVFA